VDEALAVPMMTGRWRRVLGHRRARWASWAAAVMAMRIMTATFRYFVGFYFRVIRGDISDLAVTIFPPCRRSRLVADRL
jgi:hypothetical protein